MRLIISTLALLLFAATAKADYIQGPDGYWYSNGHAFTRTWVSGSHYVSCGRLYQTAGYYTYTPVVVAAPVATVPAYTPNWKSDLIKFLEVREDRIAYENSLRAIGLSVPGGYAQPNSALYGTFGVNTSTVYGHQPQSLAQYANPFAPNLDQYFLQAFQLAQGAQEATTAANQQFNGSLQLTADRAAQIAGINARRDAVIAFSKMLDGPPSATSSSSIFKIEGGKISPAETLPPPKDAAGTLQQRWNLSAQRCATCHFGTKLEGGFDVSLFPKMAPDKQIAVVARMVLPKGDSKFMPKGGEPIPSAEISAWFEVMSQPANRSESPKLK